MRNGSRDRRAAPPIIDRRDERQLPSGTQDFESLVSDFMYVDKSPLIAHLCNRRGVTLFCRPRRFGKSCAQDMVRCFLEAPVAGWIEDRAALIGGLAVQGSGGRTLRERGRHPVISLGLDGCDKQTYEGALEMIAGIVAEEYVRHAYLLESSKMPRMLPLQREQYGRLASGAPKDEAELTLSLSLLSTLLAGHHGSKTVILIDEYDAPLIGGYLYGYRDRIVSFYQGWLIVRVVVPSEESRRVLSSRLPTQSMPPSWQVSGVGVNPGAD